MEKLERIAKMLAKLPADQKIVFFSELQRAWIKNEVSEVITKYCTVYAPELLGTCVEDPVELTEEEISAISAGCMQKIYAVKPDGTLEEIGWYCG